VAVIFTRQQKRPARWKTGAGGRARHSLEAELEKNSAAVGWQFLFLFTSRSRNHELDVGSQQAKVGLPATALGNFHKSGASGIGSWCLVFVASLAWEIEITARRGHFWPPGPKIVSARTLHKTAMRETRGAGLCA
jgi:hypothetical protein